MRGTLFGALIIRILLFRVLYLGLLIFGNSHLGFGKPSLTQTMPEER